MPLPINIEDLLSIRVIEPDRIEFKTGWNPDAIYRSICAFANDFDNTGGGYIVVGVEEEYDSGKGFWKYNPFPEHHNICTLRPLGLAYYRALPGWGHAKRPVKGLTSVELADIQKKMIGFNNLINPVFHPRLFIEEIDGTQILVIWVTGGKSRPYQVPETNGMRKRNLFLNIIPFPHP